ncbi:hemerythrin domain-containing protein [Glaciimonas immobilis]|uniref:Iron-sulfur cluster repair protein YtfE (RIC family) n=1 Tax=Glaciimonas immobilis TaxID=728004 RepID=A0A840RQJ9_9BURK|nr:hemerythrin domain-containing protein [Glaciimonas immobilis]KAF3997918.1 hemerythrin domain-containing protein [Glaciimonas immobilis]MBB5199422.1 iron-sulfur cluster repair protein YtfE (RIC family) [Glaciimonas immobilis]
METKTATKSRFKDATTLLVHDHNSVKAKFKEFESMGSRARVGKKKLADEICTELTIHAMLEEEIFYPAVQQEAEDGPALIEEATAEHAGAKALIAQIKAMSADDESLTETVQKLSEEIAHHVKEEEGEMFPKARASGLDLVALRDQMLERKTELSAEEL